MNRASGGPDMPQRNRNRASLRQLKSLNTANAKSRYEVISSLTSIDNT